jgi:hypothetical protein
MASPGAAARNPMSTIEYMNPAWQWDDGDVDTLEFLDTGSAPPKNHDTCYFVEGPIFLTLADGKGALLMEERPTIML